MSSVIRGDDNFDSAGVGKNATTGSVGSYAFCVRHGGTVNTSAGTTTAGSNLQYGGTGDPTPTTVGGNFWASGAYTIGQSGTLAGTWRCMGGGYSVDGDGFIATLWLRIS